MFLRILSVTAALIAATFSASAEEAAAMKVGPEVGTTISLDFAGPDQTGSAQNFDSFVGENGAVVVFYRSAKWCPFCQMQLIDLNTNAFEAVKDRGFGIAAISYDKVRDLERFHKKWRVNFPLISDEGSVMIDELGLRNEDYKEGHYAHGVPHPVILVLDRNKTVTAKLMREGYRDRPEPEVLIETLDQLTTSGR
ncbi:MAG: peroxiredoxin family protein [Kordiimonadaceae bacterium]|nr:peroxiredoxin family protein [Kordiimonadaceae bacterium]MBO6567641.1 peroxiredoxin family protein [Kordiimonadaceae bacterium]MBO6963145.1 peroxiredoxin family protein [Kordiimonadaceae bacterium]